MKRHGGHGTTPTPLSNLTLPAFAFNFARGHGLAACTANKGRHVVYTGPPQARTPMGARSSGMNNEALGRRSNRETAIIDPGRPRRLSELARPPPHLELSTYST